MELKNASYTSKESHGMPDKKNIIKKDTSINVEEIENGFLITKSCDIKYKNEDGNTDYLYITKKIFSEKNPLKIEEPEDNTYLADQFT